MEEDVSTRKEQTGLTAAELSSLVGQSEGYELFPTFLRDK